MQDSDFVKHFGRMQRRHKLLSAIDAILEAAFFLTTATVSILAIDRIISILTVSKPVVSADGDIIIVILCVIFVMSLLAGSIAFIKRPASAHLAKAIDDKLGGEELIMTTAELADNKKANLFSEHLFMRAGDKLSKASPRELIPGKALGYRWGILLALASFIVLFILKGDRHIFSEIQNPKSQIPTKSPEKVGTDTTFQEEKQNNEVNSPKKSSVGNQPGHPFGQQSQRPKVKLLPEGVNPLVGEGKFVEKQKSVATDKKGADSYSELFSKYKKVWEDTIHRSRVPKPMREFVKLYFEEIKPR